MYLGDTMEYLYSAMVNYMLRWIPFFIGLRYHWHKPNLMKLLSRSTDFMIILS